MIRRVYLSIALALLSSACGGITAYPYDSDDQCVSYEHVETHAGLCFGATSELRVGVDLFEDCWLLAQGSCLPPGWSWADERSDGTCQEVNGARDCEPE